MTLFLEMILHLFQPPDLSGPKIRMCFSVKNLMFCHVNTHKWYCSLTISSFSGSFVSKVGRHQTNLGILFLELFPEVLYQLRRETAFFVLGSTGAATRKKSLPVKDSAQICVVREYLHGVYVVLLEFSAHCAFGGMLASRENGGKSYQQKSPSGSSGMCPSTPKISAITSDVEILLHG